MFLCWGPVELPVPGRRLLIGGTPARVYRALPCLALFVLLYEKMLLAPLGLISVTGSDLNTVARSAVESTVKEERAGVEVSSFICHNAARVSCSTPPCVVRRTHPAPQHIGI